MFGHQRTTEHCVLLLDPLCVFTVLVQYTVQYVSDSQSVRARNGGGGRRVDPDRAAGVRALPLHPVRHLVPRAARLRRVRARHLLEARQREGRFLVAHCRCVCVYRSIVINCEIIIDLINIRVHILVSTSLLKCNKQ